MVDHRFHVGLIVDTYIFVISIADPLNNALFVVPSYCCDWAELCSSFYVVVVEPSYGAAIDF